MSGDHSKYDDEIDIFAFFETLWNGKWKIIATTFFAAIIGVVYSVNKPSSFKISTPIEQGSQSAFLAYTSLNNLFEEKNLLFNKDKNINGYQFNSKVVFKMFVTEFNDYEEMIDVLINNDFVKKKLKGLDEINKQRLLIKFAKSFVIQPPKIKGGQWFLKLQWHNDLQGIELFNKALEQTLINIKYTSKSNINELAKAIEIQKSRELETLYRKLEVSGYKQFLQDTKRLKYLKEQFAVAKELGIKTNELDADAFKENSQQLSFFFHKEKVQDVVVSNTKNIPYYLIGYDTIEKEMSMIEGRSDNDRLVLSPNYIDIKNKIISIENDLSGSHLRTSSKLIETDNPQNWVEFDLALADIKSEKKTRIYMVISIFLGGFAGSFFVIVMSAIRKRKERLV